MAVDASKCPGLPENCQQCLPAKSVNYYHREGVVTSAEAPSLRAYAAFRLTGSRGSASDCDASTSVQLDWSTN